MYNYLRNINYLGVFLLSIISLYFYFPFSAEDSYIVARYAYNFVTYRELAYNIEEPISALTSPLHAILEGALYSLINYDSVILWKFFSIVLFFVTIIILQSLLLTKSQKLFFSISVALSPSIVLWTVGGLETPLLMFWISLIAYMFLKNNIDDTKTLILLGFLSGVTFLTRFDALLFLLPMGLFIIGSNRASIRNIAAYLVPAFFIVFLWFLFSKLYYGHFMPTSFFAKKPGLSLLGVVTTFRGLFWTGVFPIVAYILIQKDKLKVASKYWVIFISLFLIVLYMFTMANKHMMFSFRPFIPYLPILFVSFIALKNKISKVAIYVLLIFEVSQLYITYVFGINYPIAEELEQKIIPTEEAKYFYHEYSKLNIPTYIKFMQILEKQGSLISEDWGKEARNRKAIVFTYAEGIASYSGINNMYVGNLVTKGSCKIPDYIMGLHFLDTKRDWGGVDATNAFVSSKLKFYISKNMQEVKFSVTRYKDLNKKSKKALLKMVENCNRIKIW